MGKVLQRSMTVWNRETGGYETLLPGDEVPGWAKDQITNPKAFVPNGYTVEEWEAHVKEVGKTEAGEELEFDRDDLKSLKVSQLLIVADEEEVELGDATKKADIVKLIEESRAGNS